MSGTFGMNSCAGALIVDIKKTNLSFYQKISIMESITEENFGKYKEQIDGNGKFLLGKIPVTADMSWGKFQEERENYRKLYKFDSLTSGSMETYHSFLSELSVDAYKACLASTRPVGMIVQLVDGSPSKDIVEILIAYNTAPGDKTKRRFSFDTINLEISAKSKEKLNNPISSEVEFTVFGTRDIDKNSIFSIETSNSGQVGDGSIRIPARPRIWKNKPLRETKTRSYSFSVEAQDSGDRPYSFGPDVDRGFIFDTSTRPQVSHNAIGRPSSPQSYLGEFNKYICTVHASTGTVGSYSAQMDVTVSAIQIKDNWEDVTNLPQEHD